MHMKIRFAKLRRKLFGFLSFSAALFVFQACYGAPQDEYNDVLVNGQLLSDSTGLPAKGIRVQVNGNDNYAVSDSSGRVSFYIPAASQYAFTFSDADTTTDGHFLNSDTVLTALPENGFTLVITEKF